MNIDKNVQITLQAIIWNLHDALLGHKYLCGWRNRKVVLKMTDIKIRSSMRALPVRTTSCILEFTVIYENNSKTSQIARFTLLDLTQGDARASVNVTV